MTGTRAARLFYSIQDHTTGATWQCLLCESGNGHARSHSRAFMNADAHILTAHEGGHVDKLDDELETLRGRPAQVGAGYMLGIWVCMALLTLLALVFLDLVGALP